MPGYGPFMSAMSAYVALSRPSNIVITFITIFVAAFITGTIRPLPNVLLACFSAAAIAIAANAINDYFDVDIDRINKPHRPLPVGKISIRAAKRFALVFFGSGIGLALLISPASLVLATISALLLYWYSQKFKRTPLWGNIIVSLATGMAFIYGGIAVGRWKSAIIPAIFSFFMHLGREIIKDIQDQDGDRQNHAQTFPIRCGTTAARMLTTIVFGILILLTLVPYWMGYYNIYYLILVLVGVDGVMVYVLIKMWQSSAPSQLNRLSNILKADMLLGLLALYLGQL